MHRHALGVSSFPSSILFSGWYDAKHAEHDVDSMMTDRMVDGLRHNRVCVCTL